MVYVRMGVILYPLGLIDKLHMAPNKEWLYPIRQVLSFFSFLFSAFVDDDDDEDKEYEGSGFFFSLFFLTELCGIFVYVRFHCWIRFGFVLELNQST
jgi:hypothetical protein